ncbi:MAG: twin-arginine translocase TatA/TatE family subunit [Kofleriaceae bacterium]
MFGMGGSEIIVILVIALLFLGPDKLPSAAKSISKGIRDIKRQSRSLQQQIESDDQIGGAIRDLKSALRGDEEPIRPKKPRKPKALPPPDNSILPPVDVAALATATASDETPAVPELPPIPPLPEPSVTLPAMVGEPGDLAPGDADPEGTDDDLASLIKPAPGTVAKGSDPEHG